MIEDKLKKIIVLETALKTGDMTLKKIIKLSKGLR